MTNNVMLQADRLDNCKYMIDVSDNVIAVNEHTTLNNINPVKNQLTFQLLNPARAQEIIFNNPGQLTADDILKKLQQGERVTNASFIRFFVPLGEREQDFIDMERAKLLSFSTEDSNWSVAAGVIDPSDNCMSFVMSCYQQTIIKTLFSMYFHCSNIQSYALPGQTYVYAEIKNTIGINDVTKVFPIQKIAAKPRIHEFFSAKTTLGGADGDQATLQWNISGANHGKLSPDEIDLFSLTAPVVQVKPGRSREYHLSVQGNGQTTNAYVHVYVRPPAVQKFECDIDKKQIIWQTDYSRTVQMKVDDKCTVVAPSGSATVPLVGKSQIVLKADGYLYNELIGLSLTGYMMEQTPYFSSRIRLYDQYAHTVWSWQTQAMNQVSLQFTEDGWIWYEHQVPATGEFEYVSSEPIVSAKLVCTKADGTHATLCLDKEADKWSV